MPAEALRIFPITRAMIRSTTFSFLPVFTITLIATIVHLIRRPCLHSALLVIVAVAAIVAVFKIRIYAIKVQDRVIRLEERLRLATLLDPALRPRILELTEKQLIALRFASDAELPALAARALNEKLPPQEIKKSSPALAPRLLESVRTVRSDRDVPMLEGVVRSFRHAEPIHKRAWRRSIAVSEAGLLPRNNFRIAR